MDEEVRDFFGEIVFETVVPRDVALTEAPSHGKTVFQYAPRSRGSIRLLPSCAWRCFSVTSSTPNKDRRLGKGLAALAGTPIDEHGNPIEQSDTAKGIETLELPVHEIENNPFQPRREFNHDEIASLAESLKNHQQLQPILVRVVDGRYQLISGERRLRATMHAGIQTIRAEVREADDRLVAELAIIENLQRKDLNQSKRRCPSRDTLRNIDASRTTSQRGSALTAAPSRISCDFWNSHRAF